MTSLFRFRRRSPENEPGSGGKILHSRRPATAASPYERPSPARQELSPPQNPSWISSIISGAGMLISSVFRSDDSSQSSSSSSSSGYSSGGDTISTSCENEDIDTTAEELRELNQERKEHPLMRDHGKAPSAIVLKSKSKLAIEQLLMQETFSRDECKKLTEILQSRVVDYPSPDGTPKEIHNTSGCAISFLGGYPSLRRHNELQDTITQSSDMLYSLSPGFSALQARRPDVHATAIVEAKKWLEEKRSASRLNSSVDCGPCSLNTNMHRYANEGGELGSPVDVAKSYMRSLPPWQSPTLCDIGFRTPQPSGTQFYKDQTYLSNNSLPSLKGPYLMP